MRTIVFNPKQFILENYAAGPVAFFQAGRYISSAQQAATEMYKDIVAKIANDDGYLDAQKWAKETMDFGFIILLTEDVQEHWLRVSQGNRASNELRMSNVFAADFAQAQGSSSSPKSSPQQPRKKRNRDTDEPKTALTAEATDGIILQSGGRSVGFVIKDEAARRYYDYHSCKPAEKSIISLGINGILDLGNDKADSQMSLFHKEEWNRLSEIFPAPKLADHHVVKDSQFIKYVQEIEESFYKRDCPLAALMAARCEYVSKGDIATACRLYWDFIDIWQHHKYALVPSGPPLSETDYIVKIWGNFLETLFRDSSLRCAWGETHCTAAKEVNNSTVIKTDLRIINDTSYEYSAGEFARSFPDEVKVSTDRTKLLIEGKFLLNRIAGHGAKTVLLFHVAGLEAKIVALSLAADGLYVAHTVAHTVLPDCVKKFSNIKESLVPVLFKYREYIDSLFDDHQSGTEAEKRRKMGLWRATSNTPSAEEVALPISTWVREGWMYPRENHPLPPPPAFFLA